MERSPEDGDYTLNFEESVMSSHTATDDEIDFRMILPSESHRRRSLGKTGRSSSIGSDPGTVSYSSVRLDLKFDECSVSNGPLVLSFQFLIETGHNRDI